MRKINRAVKIRIYPNAEQRVQIEKIIGLRVPARVEEEGLDIYEHGESAYN